MRHLARLGLLLLCASPALAVLPPPSTGAMFGPSSAVVIARIDSWKRTSWFFADHPTYRATLHLQRCFKGCAALAGRSPLELDLDVYPGLAGSDFVRLPDPGTYILFLREGEKGRFALVHPAIYALRASQPELIRELETLAGSVDAGTN